MVPNSYSSSLARESMVDTESADGAASTPYALLLRHLYGLRIGAHGLRKLRDAGRLSHFGETFDELLLRVSELLGLTGVASTGPAVPVPKRRPGLPRPQLDREASADELFLERVAAAVDAHLEDERFDVEALAAQVAVGRSHLYRRLEALLGCSPAKLILDRRLEHAAHLLRHRAGNVSEVAFAVGFKTVSHFSQRFRERFGVPPSGYAASLEAESGRPEHELGQPRYRSLPAAS